MVGTIWEVSDENYVEVAEILYQTRDEGITDMAVCRGLHRAIRSLRDSQKDIINQVRSRLTRVEERDAVPLDVSDDDDGGGGGGGGGNGDQGLNVEEWRLLLWVPYVHFGV